VVSRQKGGAICYALRIKFITCCTVIIMCYASLMHQKYYGYPASKHRTAVHSSRKHPVEWLTKTRLLGKAYHKNLSAFLFKLASPTHKFHQRYVQIEPHGHTKAKDAIHTSDTCEKADEMNIVV